MKKVGCRPPYWELQNNFQNCSSNLQLKNLGRETLYVLSYMLLGQFTY